MKAKPQNDILFVMFLATMILGGLVYGYFESKRIQTEKIGRDLAQQVCKLAR